MPEVTGEHSFCLRHQWDDSFFTHGGGVSMGEHQMPSPGVMPHQEIRVIFKPRALRLAKRLI